MGSVPDHFYRQSGVIPLRRRRGEAEVLLVTSRKGKRWVIPKGVIDEGFSPAESAAREAWEEAGIRGAISKRESGRYRYEKWGGVCTVRVFLLAVGVVAAMLLVAAVAPFVVPAVRYLRGKN